MLGQTQHRIISKRAEEGTIDTEFTTNQALDALYTYSSCLLLCDCYTNISICILVAYVTSCDVEQFRDHVMLVLVFMTSFAQFMKH